MRRGDAGGCDAGGEPVRGEWLRLAAAPADRITSEALDRPGDTLMVAGGIGNAGVTVRCRDGSAGYPDGGDGGAVVGAVREVGGGIRRQGGVAVLGAPGRPRPATPSGTARGCSSCATSLRSARFAPSRRR